MKNKKVILDTNLWISFLITHKLIEEFIDVAKRPKFERYFSTSDIKDLLTPFD